jgi:hypothetical protein
MVRESEVEEVFQLQNEVMSMKVLTICRVSHQREREGGRRRHKERERNEIKAFELA